MKVFLALLVFSVFADKGVIKEWDIRIAGTESYPKFSAFKTKLKQSFNEDVSVVEREIKRSQISVALSGKIQIGDVKSALSQMTQDGSDVKIEWRLEDGSQPYFEVTLK